MEVDVLNDVAVQQTVRSVMQQWSMESKNPNAQVLIDEAGRLNAAAFQGLLRKRNNRVVVLSE